MNQAAIDKRLLLAKNYLDDNLAVNVTLAQVTSIACLSVHQLSNLFKHQWWLTVQQYLFEQRKNKALSLLCERKNGVEQGAELMGY